MEAGLIENPILRELCRYIATALEKPIPSEVTEKAKFHLLDTLAAAITGVHLPVGELAVAYIRSLGGTAESLVFGTDHVTNAVNAALANGMLAHADETDDSHAPSISHPGCVIIPAAMAMAEREGRNGAALLRAIILGYDILTRVNMALGPRHIYTKGHGPYSIGGAWGAAAAAGALAGIEADRVRYLLSNIAQQTSGIATWMRDEEHIEKALHFGGMPARNGVAAATMIQAGFSGIGDVLTGRGNFLNTYSNHPNPEELIRGLGTSFEIMQTNIKKWSVGSPIQAALDSMLELIKQENLSAKDVRYVTVRLPTGSAHVVADRTMPDINAPHCLAVMLIDKKLTFSSSHDYNRMLDPAILTVKERIELVDDDELAAARPSRQAIVEIETKSGQVHRHHTRAVKGTADDPMNRSDITEKSIDLLEPIIGEKKTKDLLDSIWSIETLDDVKTLRPLLQP